jgi:transcriptional regulator with XRE-family HTH domain
VTPETAVTPSPTLAATASRDPSPLELGRRIKMLRVARGLTLKDVEQRGGISATHVSEIERGKASPTVGALGRIARALGLRAATLVAPQATPEITVARAGERKSSRVTWGSATLEPVTEPMSCATIGSQLLTLPVGREPALAHRHEGEEWAMVLTGTVEIRIDERPYVLREGDSIHFRAHRTHSYANLTSTPAVLITAVLPRVAL